MARQPFYTNLYVQVLAGIACGVLLGYLSPDRGAAMRPLGDGFIKLIKMLIAPIVFTHGRRRASRKMGDMKDVGRIGLTALALLRGRLDGGARDRPGRRDSSLKPGAGIHASAAARSTRRRSAAYAADVADAAPRPTSC